MPIYRWRRSGLTGADGRLADNDWCLVRSDGQAVARIYMVRGGPNGGRWLWAVQVDAQGRPWNGGTGYADTGREAKEEVERRIIHRAL